ncbi:hypothetical protein [Phocaeicola plebeius]|uniref:hypothetical protein n=1 Tax=Phocaeicola plebeius TaxID=310297 RepID=UPI00320957E7
MKKNKFNIILFSLLTLIITSCKHGEYMPDIQRANMAVFALDENSTILISDETYNVNFNVSLYYPNDKVTEARIVGIKNGDPSTIKTLQEGITEFPIKMKLSYQDLKSKFGEIVEGDQIELGMDIKMGAIWFSAFGPDGKSTVASDAISLPGSNPTLTLKRVCPLVLDDFVGSVTLNDGFAGIPTADIVKISDTELEIQGYGGETAPYGIIRLTINPKDYTVTVSKQVISASYGPYHNLAYEGSGTIDTCNGIISLSLAVTVDEGSFGSFPFEIKN